MNQIYDPNLENLCRVADKLGDLAERMVFLGGATTGLLITDPAAPSIRITRDVDVIVEVLSRAEYYQLSEGLRERGFHEDQTDDAPVCRWTSDGLLLDVMPDDESILGFGNRWYKPAIESALKTTLQTKQVIKVVTAACFVATKLEAFASRGNNDYLGSHDMEDIVMMVDGREELYDDIQNAAPEVREFLAQSFVDLLDNSNFMEALPGHVMDGGSPGRSELCVNRMRKIAGA